jgi:Transcriptional regulators
MDTAGSIITALTRIQERTELMRHGGGEVQGGLSLAETHCIHWIGTLPEANAARIAEAMGVTRGAISKMTRKLEAKGLLATRRPPDNNKELRFVLTPSGARVFDEHARCHAAAWESKRKLLAAYSPEEQRVILRFLDEICALPRHHGQKADSKEADNA